MAKKSGNNLPALFSDEAFETAQAKYNLFRKEAIGYVMNQKRSVVIDQFLNYCNITDQVKGYTFFLNLFHSKDMKVMVIQVIKNMLEDGRITWKDGEKFTSGELYEMEEEIQRLIMDSWAKDLSTHLKSPQQLVTIEFLMNEFHSQYKKTIDDKEAYNAFVGEMSQALNSARLPLLERRKGKGGPTANKFSFANINGWDLLKKSINQYSKEAGKKSNQFIVASLYHLVIIKKIKPELFTQTPDSIIANQLSIEFEGASAQAYRRILGKYRQAYLPLDAGAKKLKTHHKDLLKNFPDLNFLS